MIINTFDHLFLDQALASLYAHVQGMPESAQKRKLVTKLNQANGKGTPDVATSGSVRTVGRRHRRKSGDGLINLLTPRRKRPTHGSYNFRLPESTQKKHKNASSHAIIFHQKHLPSHPSLNIVMHQF